MIVDLIVIGVLYTLCCMKTKSVGKAMTCTLLLYICLRLVLRFRENATNVSDSLITELLTTQQAQNEEIQKIFTVEDTVAKTDKGISFGGVTHGTDNNQGVIQGNENTLNINGRGDSRTVKIWDNLGVNGDVNVSGNANIAGDINLADYRTLKVNQGFLSVNGWTGGNSGSVSAEGGLKVGYRDEGVPFDEHKCSVRREGDQMHIVGCSPSGQPRQVHVYDKLCVGNTCINEEHMKMLTGERHFFLQDHVGNKLRSVNNNGAFLGTGIGNEERMVIYNNNGNLVY